MVRREGRLFSIDHIVSSFPDWSIGHGNGTCRNTCIQFTYMYSYLLTWMEFRDRSVYPRCEEVLYRLIVR